jgi:hypothetical protein
MPLPRRAGGNNVNPTEASLWRGSLPSAIESGGFLIVSRCASLPCSGCPGCGMASSGVAGHRGCWTTGQGPEVSSARAVFEDTECPRQGQEREDAPFCSTVNGSSGKKRLVERRDGTDDDLWPVLGCPGVSSQSTGARLGQWRRGRRTVRLATNAHGSGSARCDGARRQ